MRKGRFRIGLGMAALFVLGAIVWVAVRPEEVEPTFEGKPLGVWLKGFDASQGSAEYRASWAAVRQMGTNALPRLIRDLRRRDPPFFKQWIWLKSKLGLLDGGADYAVLGRRRAARGCAALGGETGAAAYPAMMEAMNDPGAAPDVGNALSGMMPRSVPVLTNVLATGNARARSQAAFHLRTAHWHRGMEEMARTALVAALRDPDPGVRMDAAGAFHLWNTNLDLIVPELTRALSDPDASVRGNAATTLGDFGGAAKEAVPELVRLLADTNSYVSGTVGDRARMMLLKIEPEAVEGRAGAMTKNQMPNAKEAQDKE